MNLASDKTILCTRIDHELDQGQLVCGRTASQYNADEVPAAYARFRHQEAGISKGKEQWASQGASTSDRESRPALGALWEIVVLQYQHYPGGPSPPMRISFALLPLRWALLLWKRLCQMKASDRSSSTSLLVHSLVGKACRNIRISWKFMARS